MTVSFTPSETGLAVTDRVEQRQCVLQTPEAVSASATTDDRFVFPVDNTVAVDAHRVTLASRASTYVRDGVGTMLGEVDHNETREFPEGRYDVELCAPIKLYLRVQGPLTIASGSNTVEIRTGGDHIHVGGRSHHKQPEATITITDDPADLMRAVSAFGSALKTTSPERSFPTLRGHPPEIRLGSELSIPDGLEPPETGITLELPPEREAIYPAASLAYYLGATVEPGDAPRLVTDEGFTYEFATGADYESDVARVLKQTFFLDCLTRTEGLYPVDLHERAAVEAAVDLDLDFAETYDRSPAERLAAYLSVPFHVLEPHVPEWKLTTHVEPSPANAELLPFLVDDLAIVRMARAEPVAASRAQAAAIGEFTRDARADRTDPSREIARDGGTAVGVDPTEAVGDFVRSAADGNTATASAPPLIEPEPTDSLEQAWAGSAAPIGASKVTIEAFRNRLARGESDGDIDITVVCNDPAMGDEQDLAEAVYGSRESLPFDVQLYHDLSTAALRAVLETDLDFLHYIGHIDADGFECADGKLDVRSLDPDGVGVDAFFLNACTSYEQGMALIERGAIGGVVTLADVLNSGAVRVGRTMVRLLNEGFPLRAALTIAKERSIVGGHYIVVGDGNVDVVQVEGGIPMSITAESADGGFDVTVHAYPAGIWQLGSFARLMTDRVDKRFLTSGEIDTLRMDREEFAEFLSNGEGPVTIDGEFHWSSELTTADLDATAD